MDGKTFGQITDKIMELTGNSSVFKDLQLVSYDESTHYAVIMVRDACSKAVVRMRYTNEVVEAFDSVLGAETTVGCTHQGASYRQPHERFIW